MTAAYFESEGAIKFQGKEVRYIAQLRGECGEFYWRLADGRVVMKVGEGKGETIATWQELVDEVDWDEMGLEKPEV